MTDTTESQISPELQAAIDQAVEAATTALKAKNSELITEVRNLKKAKTEAEDAAETAAQEAAAKSGDIEALKASLAKQHKAELDKIAQERDAANTQLKTLLIDNTISKALVDSNVAAHFHDPLTAMFRANAELRDGKAMRGDEDLLESITGFLSGDLGKHYITAPLNSGGGATGSTSTPTKWTKENFNQTEFMKLYRENPAEARAVDAQLGLGYLD